MASPSEEIRSREAEQERQARTAAEQTSVGAAYGFGPANALAGWGRFPGGSKAVPYPSKGGPVSKR